MARVYDKKERERERDTLKGSKRKIIVTRKTL